MLSKQDKLAIEAYISGKLSGKDLATFKQRLEGEPTLLRAVFLEKMIVEATEKLPEMQQSFTGLVNARKLATSLGDDLFTNTEKEQLWKIRQQNESQTYTYAELLKLFKTVKEYEENLVLRADSSNVGIAVTKPSNGIEASEILDFELSKAIPFPLKCILQNNQDASILEENIPAHQQQFTIELPNLKPGRYYWILKVASNDRQVRRQYKTVIGSFFVKTWLNPY